jgi:hypothetical protein
LPQCRFGFWHDGSNHLLVPQLLNGGLQGSAQECVRTKSLIMLPKRRPSL